MTYDYPNYLGLHPIHQVRDWSYVRKLIRAARRGEEINPIFAGGQPGNGWLLAGTHRAAANEIMEMLGETNNLIPVVWEDDITLSDDLKEAIDNSDYESIDDIWDRNLYLESIH